ncbi:NADPH:quinone reductase or related Zn-dependent oxidoreductase [Pseudomonas syringae pv. actinidiae]|uniref:NADPH:quinone reductase or related Zn-dependent oxidoreductase n=1 Tax=Pseudomonas syringae pv. actinidiae TaxID=103796 RepID=A0AAN4Q3G4_PSESF|nr:NADPH:quinone reductase or related Zn-dependent oxidoreductase [Pseudomonas syringae pv. actinidiae]
MGVNVAGNCLQTCGLAGSFILPQGVTTAASPAACTGAAIISEAVREVIAQEVFRKTELEKCAAPDIYNPCKLNGLVGAVKIVHR